MSAICNRCQQSAAHCVCPRYRVAGAVLAAVLVVLVGALFASAWDSGPDPRTPSSAVLELEVTR